MKQKNKDYAALARSRADMYHFIAAFYVQEPTEEFLNKVLDQQFLTTLSEVLYRPSVNLLHNFALSYDGDKEKVRQEYHNLFLVPLGQYLTPYESVYRTGLMSQKPQAEVVVIYKQAGAEFKPRGDVLPDHIGAELDFLSFLCQREADSWEKEDKEAAVNYLKYQVGFLNNHLVQWLEEFCKAMEQKATLGFYKGVAGITRHFVAGDHQAAKESLKMLGEEIPS